MNILFMSLLDIDINDKQSIYGSVLNEIRKMGHDITIVSPNERRKKLPTQFFEKDNVKYINVRTGNLQKANIIEKGISTVLIEGQFKRAIKKYSKQTKFDLIVYSTPPITFCNVISYFKKRDNARTYLMLKDIFPQNAVDLGYFKKNSPIYKFFRSKEIKLYNISDKIGCMSPANKKYLLKHNNFLDNKKVEIFPNTITPDKNNLRNLDKNKALRKKYKIAQKATVFMYGGNLGKPQGIDFLVKCLEKQKNKNIFFIICGNGTEYKKLLNLSDNKNIDNLLLINGLPKKEYTDLLNIADVGLIFLDYNFTIPNFPSRLLSYCEKGIPILCCTDKATDIGLIVENNSCGWAIHSNNVENFTKMIESIANNKKEIAIKGKHAIHYLETKYNSKIRAKLLLKTIENLQITD